MRFIPTGVGNGPSFLRWITRWSGSSPRVWGTVFPCSRPSSAFRFIPTGVGNGFSSSARRRRRTVHPHGCGERRENRPNEPQQDGSSPRVWGTGFIFRSTRLSIGSSPRVWGTEGDCLMDDLSNRFIPTGVGNGKRPWSGPDERSVHPHGCGEREIRRQISTTIHGSSPRVWGTENQPQHLPDLMRFIPTGVGNGSSLSDLFACISGSSPRVWGTVNAIPQAWIDFRFIPTGVGNGTTPPHMGPLSPVHPHGCGERIPDAVYEGIESVHPHGCGERIVISARINPHPGSSPRVWGTDNYPWCWIINFRFIPTGVGNGSSYRF